MNVKLDWLMNNMINHTKAKILFVESDGNADSYIPLCEKYDEKYEVIKEELFNRIIYFISIKEDKIKIFLRPKDWKGKK